MSIWILYSSDPLTRASIRPLSIFRCTTEPLRRRSARAAGGSRSRCSSPGSSHHALPQKVEAMVRPSILTGEDRLPLFEPLGDFPRRLGTPLRHRNVRLESVVVPAHRVFRLPGLVSEAVPELCISVPKGRQSIARGVSPWGHRRPPVTSPSSPGGATEAMLGTVLLPPLRGVVEGGPPRVPPGACTPGY